MSSPTEPSTNRIDSVHPDAPDLAGYGNVAVGVTTVTLVRRDPSDAPLAGGSIAPPDRTLMVEIWYPAAPGQAMGTVYDTELRDGVTRIQLQGRAVRDAAPASGAAVPLVLISHGYPGNRFLMSHLGETLASRGFVVAAVDHAESTYSDKADFAETLVHRPSDQRFVIDALTKPGAPFSAMIDAENVGVVGYSMGAYGALVFGGAGLSDAARIHTGPAHRERLDRYAAESAAQRDLVDPRVKAVVLIGLWGAQHGFWDAASLAAFAKPCLLIGGSKDDVSGYETGIRRAFLGLSGVRRHLLTFTGAGHNAGAPIPAPAESWTPSDALDFLPAEHYADPVWDSVRMNNVAQHFVSAFFGHHLAGNVACDCYLPSVPVTDDLPGFAPGSAAGLRFETLEAGEPVKPR